MLGRCKSPPPGTVIDLDHSWLSDVDFRGSYGDLRLSHGVFGRISISANVQYLSAAYSRFKGEARFWHMDAEGGGTVARSVFENYVSFEGSTWRRDARFDLAEFHDLVNFNGMRVAGRHEIEHAKFAQRPDLDHAIFESDPPDPIAEWWRPFEPPTSTPTSD